MSSESVLSLLWKVFYHWIEAIVFFFVPRRWRFKDVSNDIVLITGGGNGIGRLMAVKFVERKAKVVVWDIDESGLNETKKLCQAAGGECHPFVCDVSNRVAVYETADKVRREIGNVTILVNNAGIVSGKKFMELEDQQIEKTMNVNAMSHFWTCKAFLPSMIESNSGHVVAIASVLGLGGAASVTDYSTSKFTVIGFQENLWIEMTCLGYDGINFTTVCPYHMKTEMFGDSEMVLPSLEPEAAVDEIMTAILTNQLFLIIPKYFYIVPILKFLMPYKSTLAAMRILDVDYFLNHSLNNRTALNNNKKIT